MSNQNRTGRSGEGRFSLDKGGATQVIAAFKDGFKRHPDAPSMQGEIYDAEKAFGKLAAHPLERRLKNRHMQMIALGGTIGAGLFVGSGLVLEEGGPASAVIAYSITGIMLYFTLQGLAEMAVLYPMSGSFCTYATRFLDPAWGFALGWIYASSWFILLPFELVAATLTIQYWDKSGSFSVYGFITLMLCTVAFINLFGIRGYAEAEFLFSAIKVMAIIGFIILGTVIAVSGERAYAGPYEAYVSINPWQVTGAFNNGFKGLSSVFVTAAFAYGGTEMTGLAAAEAKNPRKSVPRAINQVFWRITLFYIVTLAIIGCLVQYNDPRLVSASYGSDASASPFVIAIENAGIMGLPSVMNAVIMISAFSVGNSCVYGATRTLTALAELRQAPRMFAYIDKQGRPVVSTIFVLAWGLLAYIGGSSFATLVFTWLIAISGLASIVAWMSISVAHIRFRAGWAAAGRTPDELPLKSPTGVWGSWIALTINVLVLMAQVWTVIWPIGYGDLSTADMVEGFFTGGFLTVGIAIFCYFPYKWIYGTKIVRVKDMDLDVGALST